MDLNKKIRKTLLEKKEEKKRFLLEQRICEERLRPLVDTVLENDNFFFDLIGEAQILSEKGISEQQTGSHFWDMIKTNYGDAVSNSILEYAKEQIIKKLFEFGKLDANSWLAVVVRTFVGNISLQDFPKLTNCRFFVDKLSMSIAEAAVLKLQQKVGGAADTGISSIFRNAVMDVINESTLAEAMKDGLSGFICPFLGKIDDSFSKQTETMKKKAIS